MTHRLVRSITLFFRSHREIVIFLIGVAISAGFYLSQPGEADRFMTWSNWRVIAVNISTDALMVIGMTLVIIAGGFDLSVGSTFALSGILCAKLMVAGHPVPVAILVGMASGALIGGVNGFIITKVGVNPLITTLGTMSIVRGLCQVITQANPVTGLPASFAKLGGDWHLVGKISWPITVMIMVVLVALFDLLLRRARFFRYIYAVGGNAEAARLSGINVDWVKSSTYILTGLLAGLAGILNASRLTTATANAGIGAELRVISAVVMGGASLSGGQGTVLGAFLGLLMVGIIQNGMEMLQTNIYMKNVVLGGLLILAVTLDRMDGQRIKGLIRWFRD